MTIPNGNTTELNEQGLSTHAGYFQVYHIDPQTREYIGSSREYLMEGVGIPAHSFADAPPDATPEQAIVRSQDGLGWDSVVDYRGRTAYDKQTRQATPLTQPGALADNLTLLVPQTECDVWQGEQWQTDTKAMQALQVNAASAQRSEYLARAQQQLVVLQDAVDLNIATEQETAALKAWKTYRVQLNRIDVSNAPDIDWPAMPA
ncbi:MULTISPECIES: tail fiber assembly protein [Dickeya]|uniref:Tail fiber assembly protein n=1 Tax=Dickeya aquatica TaxID=1401087 RepID=A0A375ABU1_9GAMM|nr:MULTISPECIES: tail fiber assembly protein [Dickeya]SLM63447.1 Tail fiber assembly protein [Dickeya aquatica]